MEADLFDNGDAGTPRPAWQVIEAARRRYLTGVLTLDTTPPTNIYLRDGQVYFAERTTDGGLGVRLLVEGVITREQMHKGTLQVSGVEHLGRMFERDASIDRDAVELCVELMTDDVLTHVAKTEVRAWKLQMYKRHPSGLDRWLPTRVEVVTHVVEGRHLAEEGATVTPGDGPRSQPHLTPPPVAAAVAPAAPAAAPVAARVVAATPAPAPTPAPAAAAPVAASTIAPAPVPVAETAVPTLPPPITGEHQIVPPPRVDEPANAAEFEATTELPATDSGIHLADSAADAIMGNGIADEVAEAVRRALAAIEVPQ